MSITSRLLSRFFHFIRREDRSHIDGAPMISPWPRAENEAQQGSGELFLIDGNSLAYRAFFALPESIATSDGRPTNAIYGFASMMVKILDRPDPQAVASPGTPACRAARRSTSPTRRSASRAPTCSRSSGRTWRRWPRRSASPTSGSRAGRPTT